MIRVLAATIALALLATPVTAGEPPSTTIVATSGVPHWDIGDYTQLPRWDPGDPKGANWWWRRYMRGAVDQLTASNPDAVAHSGDIAFGIWHTYHESATNKRLYGPYGTLDEKRAMLNLAADTVWPWMAQWWDGHRVLWGRGDHEIGAVNYTHRIVASQPRYKLHWEYTKAFRRHFGRERTAALVGDVGVITLDPYHKFDDAIYPHLPRRDRRWFNDRVERLRDRGARWIVVQSEVPVLGPNRHRWTGTSAQRYRNWLRVWRMFKRAGVDVFVGGEFHDDTTYTRHGSRAPVHVVTGGWGLRMAWLQLDAYADRLELTLWESRGSAECDGRVWAPSTVMANRCPVNGTPTVTGTAVLRDGTLVERTGYLREADL